MCQFDSYDHVQVITKLKVVSYSPEIRKDSMEFPLSRSVQFVGKIYEISYLILIRCLSYYLIAHEVNIFFATREIKSS